MNGTYRKVGGTGALSTVFSLASLFFAQLAWGGEALPDPVGGVVTLVSGHTYTLTEADDLSAITQINVVEGSTLEYDIAEDQTLAVPCFVKGKGMVIKNGPGTVTCTNASTDGGKAYYIEYPGYVIVNEGTLQGPHYTDANKWSPIYFGRLVVNSPGKYDIACPGAVAIYGLWGDGEVTCTHSGSYNELNICTEVCRDSSQTYCAPSKFSGLISGTHLRMSPSGYFDILSTANTCNDSQVIANGASIGLALFGEDGKAASLGMKNFCTRSSATLRYLGTGETTTKTFGTDAQCGNYVVDAGATGGLILAGKISLSSLMSGFTCHTFGLAGDNTTRSSVTGTIVDHYSTFCAPLGFKKTGTGTWRLASDTKGDYSGLVAAENGTLEYTSVAPKGVTCSLGTATNATDCAILLGSSSSVGTFSYVGTSRADVTTRPISLTGKGGRLVADSGILDWTGISSASASTLYLAGDANTNTVRKVSGATSVVKEGAGTWCLTGTNAFTGALTVNGGTLVAEGDASQMGDCDFRWFKFVIRGQIGKVATDHGLELEELAFYDANGVRQLNGFSFVKSYATGTDGYVAAPDLSNIQPGQYGWLKCGTEGKYQYMTNRDADKLFDDNTDGAGMGVNGGVTPVVTNPDSWFVLLIRLPTDMPKIAAFDVLGSNNFPSQREVTNWTLLGSEDGFVWRTVKTYDDSGTHVNGEKWYSDRTAFKAGEVRKGEGYPARLEASSPQGGCLANVTKATVGAGGTLQIDGAADFPSVELSGGTLLVDAGTTNAYGSLAVTAAGSKMTVPDGSRVAFGDSEAVTWSADARLDITTEGSGEVAFGSLTPQQMMRVYVNGVAVDELDSERIAFLGDGITCSGFYEYFLQDFELTRNPNKAIRILNCGLPDDTTAGALARLESDVFAQKPARVAILLGMNDVGLADYCENPTATQLANQAASLATFAENLTNLVDQILARDIDVTLFTPTPYDEYAEASETYAAATNRKTANEKGLASIAQIVRDLAAYRHVTLVDLHAPMTAIYKTSATQFNETDRATPTEAGHALAALLVWKQFGYGAAPFSECSFAAPGGVVSAPSYTPDALPFPSAASLQTAKAAIPDDYTALNRELVRFSDLPTGTFTLLADGTSIGDCTTAQLSEGINIAERATPALTAADAAWSATTDGRASDLKLRNFVFMEIKAKAYDPSVDVTDFDAVTNALEQWYLTLATEQERYRALIDRYESEKPNETAIRTAALEDWREVRVLGIPETYPLTLAQVGLVTIPPDQGDVELTEDQLKTATAISIGANSRLVIATENTSATTFAIPANISGAGTLCIRNSYVNLSGDNRAFTGVKAFTNAFVTVSSRYGLGSPDVELLNHITSAKTGYLHFAGDGLTNDVPVYITGSGYAPSQPATAFTAHYLYPLQMNGRIRTDPSVLCNFNFGNYVLAGGIASGSFWNGYTGSGYEPWITGPFDSYGSYYIIPSLTVHLKAHPDSVRWQDWLYVRWGRLVCESANVWGKNLALGNHDGDKSASGGTFDLNGYDQSFGKVTFCYDGTSVQDTWTNLKLYVTSAKPATLTMTGGTSNRQGIRFTGAAGLTFTGTGVWTNALFASTSTGTLTVGNGTNKGEVFFDWGARWNGDVVLNGGRFGCDTSRGLNSRATVTITNGGQLIVPAGVTLRALSVSVDGVVQPNATYQGVSWIKGEGKVECGRRGFALILK